VKGERFTDTTPRKKNVLTTRPRSLFGCKTIPTN
jgi:hypothetical protein